MAIPIQPEPQTTLRSSTRALCNPRGRPDLAREGFTNSQVQVRPIHTLGVRVLKLKSDDSHACVLDDDK